ncbi:hypothetical protein [Microcoleus sp. SVA1B1]|uniref:hypothetical protein n=1 Tax=Microcoleus sp. SVA1B1 TaxID=3055422 RepID=UPI002FD693E9
MQKRLVNVRQHVHQTFHQCRHTALGDSIMLLQPQHLVVVERSFNRNCTVKAFGKTPEEAAEKVWNYRREYGYWDATKTSPKAKSPEPGTEKGSPRDDR